MKQHTTKRESSQEPSHNPSYGIVTTGHSGDSPGTFYVTYPVSISKITCGGYYRPKGRKKLRVWIPWKGKTVLINKYLDGTPLFHDGQAQIVLQRIRNEIGLGTFNPAEWTKDTSQVFQNAWTYYMKQYPAKSRASSEERKIVFRYHLLPYWKDKLLKDIEDTQIAEWFVGLKKVKGKGKGEKLAPSSLKQIVSILKAFLNSFSVTRRKALRFPKVSVPKKIQPWLTEEEQDLVLKFIPQQHKRIITFIVTYGCRPSEACNLRNPEIDWDKKIVVLKERKNRQDNSLPFIPEIEAILRKPEKSEHWEYQFRKPNGLKYVRQDLYKIWEKANREAMDKYGVKVIPLKNATRHSLASRLINNDIPIPAIARVLGNSPSQIERVYGKVSVNKVAEVLELKRKAKREGR